jgi:hypothetical protein
VRFLLLICIDPSVTPDEEPGEINRWVESVEGVRIDGGPLRPPATAATVRVRGGQRVVTDGPFAKTEEYVAGYDLLECDSREQAIEIAAAHPVARFGSIEVRQLHEG